MRRARGTALFVWWALMLSLIFVTGVRADDDIELLLKEAAVDQAINASVDNFMEEILAERITGPNTALNDDEMEVYFEKLSAATIKQKIVATLGREFTPDDIQYLHEFYRKGEMLRYMSRVLDVYTPEFFKNKREFIQSLTKKPLTRERITLISDVSDASMVVAQRVFLHAAITRAIAKSKLEYFKKYNDEEKQKLDYYILNYKDSIRAGFRKDILLTHAYLYSVFSDEELKSLLALFHDEKKMKFEMTVTDAFANALTEGFDYGMKAVLKYREKPSA